MPVDREDPEYKAHRARLDLALKFANDNEDKFDDSFLLSLEKNLEGYGSLTARQLDALERLISRWKMEEYVERFGL